MAGYGGFASIPSSHVSTALNAVPAAIESARHQIRETDFGARKGAPILSRATYPAPWGSALRSAVGCLVASLLLIALCACSGETRPLEPEQPRTAPNGANDPRIAHYQDNAYQISQGARYFGWYGCQGCHGVGAVGDLADGGGLHRRAFDAVYAFIAHGHAGELATQGGRIPVEQLWQITAYVRDLKTLPDGKRRRRTADQMGEPQATRWSGPLR